MSAQYPSILRGKRAESLSSGDMMTPYRSKLRKSLVKANDTPGPPREYDVYVIAYCCSSGTKVTRGSSIPQSSSGYSFGLDSNVGSLSISQLSTPFRERAAQRWDMPRRSSTLHSSKVDPSANNVAPALNTLLIE